TVTFQFPKVCHLLHPSAKRCGRLYVANIGIPQWLAKDVKRELLVGVEPPQREPDVHKGKMGHVLLVGASVGKVGALVMSARASTRAGAGLVSVAFPKGLYTVVESLLVEEMTIPIEGQERISYQGIKRLLELQDRFSAVGVGMGMDRYEEGQRVIKELVLNLEKPLLLDADALNNLSDLGVDILLQRKHPTILTPHVGEFQRLSGYRKEEIVEGFLDLAQEFAQRYGCHLVLKSSRTAVALPDGRVFLSTRGTPAMAKGGVGDVLAGILTALIGRGLPIEHALSLGVFLHGLAGEVAHRQSHAESVKALDLVECLPTAYNLIENGAFEPAFTYLP
ncbi:MAG: NAD(P)H-hydrate dehydratase, partial [Aquificota bacterium]